MKMLKKPQAFGDVVSHTDVIRDTREDPVLNDMLLQAGENIGRTSEASISRSFALAQASSMVMDRPGQGEHATLQEQAAGRYPILMNQKAKRQDASRLRGPQHKPD